VRLGQQDLHVPDAGLGKARFAVAEVERPQAPEALVVAESGSALGVAMEARAPAAQSLAPYIPPSSPS